MAVLVGKRAPSFKATAIIDGAIVEEYSLDRYLGKKHVILYFYPDDFSLLYPVELLAFQQMLPDFEKRSVAVVACSTDSHLSHRAWLRTPRDQAGIQGVTYPLVGDATKTIAANYDVLAGHYDYNEQGEMVFVGTPTANRALFLIDRDGIVRHQTVTDGPLGRNAVEALRMVDALQYYENHGSLTPSDWTQGDKGLNPVR